jgi:transmembrane sensor
MANQYNNIQDDIIHEQACLWAAFFQSDADLSDKDEEFKMWLAQSECHKKSYNHVILSMEALDIVRDDTDILALRKAALKRPQDKKQNFDWIRIAAVMIFVTCAGYLLIGQNFNDIEGFVTAELKQNTHKNLNLIETAIGERSTVTLSDGSVIQLDTNTQIRTRFTPDRRLIVLTRGQAGFEVAKNVNRPFIVLAGDQKITAVGTEFEVRTGAKGTAVTLLEGKVLINEIKIITEKENTVPLASVELVPGDRFIASPTASAVIVKADISKISSWREGRVDFENQFLKEVIEEINRYSIQKIILKDQSLMELRVSGSFKTGSVDHFLIALSEIYPITTVHNNTQIFLEWETKN